MDEFLDIDFELCPEYVRGDNGAAIFGDLCSGGYREKFGVMSDRDIDAAIELLDANGGGADMFVSRIYDQGQEGSCVANACCQANEIVQAKQFGIENVIPLSAISLYKRIGRSASSGASVSDGLKEMETRGVLPLDTPENRKRFKHVMPNTGFRQKMPDGWEPTAGMFEGVEATIIRKEDELWTALCRQEPVVVGRSGHSICYCRPMRDGRGRKVKYANSWGNWGDKGFGYDSQRMIASSARWAFALRTVRVPTWRLAA